MRAPQISCSFSGHRPEKLPWGDNERDERCVALKAAIREMVQKAYDDGYRHFICGMARGCDTYFCEEVLAGRRSSAPAIRICWHCAITARWCRKNMTPAACTGATAIWWITVSCCWPCTTAVPAARAIPLSTHCGSAVTCWCCRYPKSDKIKEKFGYDLYIYA